MTKPPVSKRPLIPEQLCANFKINNARHKKDLFDQNGAAVFGQERAAEAIRFSAQTPDSDFNVFVMGRQGFERHAMTLSILRNEAKAKSIPVDWVYVHNFIIPHKPIAISLKAGTAVVLKKAMETLIDDLANDIPALFEADAYKNKRRSLEQEFGEKHESAFSDLMAAANEKNLVLLRTPMGFMVAATKDGRPMKPEEFQALGKNDQDKIDKNIRAIQDRLEEVLKQIPKREKEHRTDIEKLNSKTALSGVDNAFKEIEAVFGSVPNLKSYIEAVKTDLIENADQFLETGPAVHDGAFPVATTKHYKEPQYLKYSVNVMVSNDPDNGAGAPVVTEQLPTLGNLVGRIEHMSHMGALVTDFSMIRPGALHRANSGFLMLDARQILSEPFAWDALKRCIRSRQISIESLEDRLSLFSTASLEPEAIPLTIRVALIGERSLYYLLTMFDPEFSQLFKVQADFQDEVWLTEETAELFAGMTRTMANRNGLLPLNNSAIHRLLVEATRLAEDSYKISLNSEHLFDIIREASFLARRTGKETIDAELVERSISAAEERAARPRELTHEAICRNTILMMTSGSVVGQINALSVLEIGNSRFGRPSRITARVRAGRGKIIDIEREVELGGPLHSKGVLILSGYLASQFALNVPLSLWASIVFEQSYGGVDGDSASAAELLVLLSAIAQIPISQSLAITGSVNQYGEIQPIGGVNEKIEGFFDVCAARGLTGEQGVIIPMGNVKNLALRERVVAAVKDRTFRIIPIATIDDGIGILTGYAVGKRNSTGNFPDNSVNGKVERRLMEFAEQQRAYLEKTPWTLR